MKFSDEKTWYEELSHGDKPHYSGLTGDTKCDVCIVGGGLVAVVAALNLAEDGKDVVVLEASDISYGSTGRAGVPLFSGLFHTEYRDLKKKMGAETARRVWEQTLRARKDIDERMKRHNISCGYVPGIYFAGKTSKHKNILGDRFVTFGQDFKKSDPVELLNGKHFHERVKCTGFSSALYHKSGGSMNLVKFLYDLIRVAEEKGVRFYEKTHVSDFDFDTPNVITTARGQVVADKVIISGSAYMPEFSAPDDTSTITTTYYQWVSKPLSANLAAELSAGREAVFDMQLLPQYYQVTLDNRIMVGGPDHYLEKDPILAAAKICERTKQVFPQAMNLKTDYLWRGRIGTSMYSPPVFEQLSDSAFLVHGVSGHGTVVAYMCGLILADAAKGDKEEFDIFIGAQLPRKAKRAYLLSTWLKLMQHRWQNFLLNLTKN